MLGTQPVDFAQFGGVFQLLGFLLERIDALHPRIGGGGIGRFDLAQARTKTFGGTLGIVHDQRHRRYLSTEGKYLVDIGLILTRQRLQFAGQLGGGFDVLDKVLCGRINIDTALNAPAKIARRCDPLILVGLKVFTPRVVARGALGNGLHIFEDFRCALFSLGLLLGQLLKNGAPLCGAECFPFLAQFLDRAFQVDSGITGFFRIVTEQQKTRGHGAGHHRQTGGTTQYAQQPTASTAHQGSGGIVRGLCLCLRHGCLLIGQTRQAQTPQCCGVGIGEAGRGDFRLGGKHVGRCSPCRSGCNVQLCPGLANCGGVGRPPGTGLRQQHF